jgi:magnesium transporter
MTSDTRDTRPILVPSDDDATIDAWPTLSEDQRLAYFQSLPRGDASELFLSLDPGDQFAIVSAISTTEQRVWLRLLPPEDVADLIQQADDDEQEPLLALLDHRTRPEVDALLAYKADVAGGRMSPSYAWMRPSMTVAQAVAYLRLQSADRLSMIYYAYVLDAEERLLGVVSFRELLASPASRRVDEVMLPDLISVHEDTDQEAVARVLQDNNLLAVPVVDDEGRIKGIITVDDVIDVVEEEATEDIQKIGGVEALDLPYFRTSIMEMLRKRGGWLSLLLVGEMLTATAMAFFEHEIAQAVVLAVFVPLVISSGGNAGSQASTLVIRAMALEEVRLRDWLRVVRRELAIGLGLGAMLCVIGFGRISLWQTLFGSYGTHYVALAATVALSLIGVVTWGTLVGSTLPMALRRLRFDPANASAPLVATLSDVTGLIIYFSIAKVLLLPALASS